MKRILVADDSPSTRSLISAVLTDSAEFQVERVSTGLEAIKLLSTTRVDLVLTDVHMPDINGLELIRFVKGSEHLKRIPIVVISTEAGETDRLRAVSLGANDYLAKPFTAEQLRYVINKYLSA